MPKHTYPERFYYTEKSDAASFKSNPPGTLNVQRLIEGKKAFESPVLARQQKPKTLILADWRAQRWSIAKIEAIQLKLKQMMTEEENPEACFEFYRWSNDKVLPLNLTKLSDLSQPDTRQSMMPAQNSRIKEAAEAVGLSQNKVFVLDSYWMDCLLEDDFSLAHVVRTSDFKDAAHAQQMTEYLQSMTPPPALFIHEHGESEKLDLTLQDFKEILGPIEEKLRKISYMSDAFFDALLSIPLLGLLSNLEEIKLSWSNISFNNLVKLLQHTSNLKKLNVIRCKNLNDAFEAIPEGLSSLEEINLSGSNISSGNLVKLLQHTPNLKKLDLRNCRNLNDPFETMPENLENLEEIDLSSSNISSNDLVNLLQNTPNLKKLNLSNCKNLNDAFDTIPGNLENLEVINLSWSNISSGNLIKLLQHTPNLKKLNLSGCENLNDAFDTIPGNLEKLEDINLSGSHISDENLVKLLQHTPNLKKLDLSHCKKLGDAFEAMPISLEKLEEINLSESHISYKNLVKLLQDRSNLKKLNVCGCENLNDAFNAISEDLEDLEDLEKIEEIDLSLGDISSDSLINLLQHTPNLKKLDLSSCKNLNDAFETMPGNLENLEEINLSGSHISYKNLINLLQNTTSLKRLHVNYCNNLTDAFETMSGNFESLEEIHLSGSDISSQNLIALLKSAPNLSNLRIPSSEALNLKNPELEDLLKNIAIVVNDKPRSVSRAGIGLFHGLSSLPSHNHRPSTPREHGEGSSYSNPIPKIGAETRKIPDKILDAHQIFYSTDSAPAPNVEFTRMNIYDHLAVNQAPCPIDDVFSLERSHDLTLEPRHIQPCPEDVFELVKALNRKEETDNTYYYGKQTFSLTHNWQPIASLSPDEELTHYHVDPKNAAIEIQYALSDNQYFIKSNSGLQTINLDFAVRVPPKQLEPLPQAIQDCVAYYLSFGSGALSLDTATPTGEDYLEAIISQKKGSCRHRAVAFKSELDRRLKIPSRVVINECHAFVEVLLNEQWHPINLGGYKAQLRIDDSNRPKPPGALHRPHTRQVIFDGQSHQPDLSGLYLNTFATWEKARPAPLSALEYAVHCLQSNAPKRLIECQSDEQLHALRAMMQLRATRPVFYINKPDDLVCAASYLTRSQDNQGIIHKGPGGPLYDFLQHHPDGTLIIDYSSFEAEDIVRCNTILETKPAIDGIPLPEQMKLIGLMNLNKPDCYQGSDFYSRFEGQVETCPMRQEDFIREEPRLEAAHDALNKATVPGVHAEAPLRINLFDAQDWRERLLGRWILDGERLYYHEGALAQLHAGQPLEIINGPWENPDFQQFWVDIQSVGIPHPAGAKDGVDMPPFLLTDNPIQRTEGYDWETLLSRLTLSTEKTEEAIPCNPTLLPECFHQHHIQDGLFYQRPGWIEQAQQTGLLTLHLTRSLNEDDWAMLLTEAEAKGITVQASMAPGVDVPSLFSKFIPVPTPLKAAEPTHVQAATQVVITTDLSTTVHRYTEADEDWSVIDVSECEPQDLLIETNAQFDEAHSHFRFYEKKRLLLQALTKNQSILLKGTFSDALKDMLAPFLDEREKNPHPPGRLLLVTEHENDFSDLTARTYDAVHVSDKIKILIGPEEENREYLEPLRDYLEIEPLATLKARLQYLKTEVQSGHALNRLNSDNAWIGLRTLPDAPRLIDTFDFETSAQQAHAFMQKRLDSFSQRLHAAPYVFLSGPTGSGKTTFIEHFIAQSKNYTLYTGETELKAWADNVSEETLKILFIDEANLAHKDWTLFDGLFQNPPALLINGKLHPLTAQHKVVFAGNPTSYSEDRKLPTLLKEHGCTLYFEPLPKAVLYENILKPVFENQALAPETIEAISTRILNVYDFIKPLSKHDVLLSPREMQTMALLIQAEAIRTTDEYGASSSTPSIDEETIQRITWHYARPWVPEKQRNAFDARFQPKKIPDEHIHMRHDFIVTPSRNALIQQMDDWLHLRQMRIDQQKQLNDPQRHGGLGGFVIEGPPGIGKSDIVLQNLIHHGYVEAHHIEQPAKGNRFYRIPASLSLSEKETRLRKAFHEGAVVIMDEINASPMMERLMNALLMGRTPEGQPPQNPGFFVIGTQNPVSMAGRRTASKALAHRFNPINLEPYTEPELKAILEKKGIETKHAQAMAKAFLIQCQNARQNNHKPQPTFRDLMATVKQLLQAKQPYEQNRITPSAKPPQETTQTRDAFFDRKMPDEKTLTPKNSLEHNVRKSH